MNVTNKICTRLLVALSPDTVYQLRWAGALHTRNGGVGCVRVRHAKAGCGEVRFQ